MISGLDLNHAFSHQQSLQRNLFLPRPLLGAAVDWGGRGGEGARVWGYARRRGREIMNNDCEGITYLCTMRLYLYSINQN